MSTWPERLTRAHRDWSIPRQLRGQDAFSVAAMSDASRRGRPRLDQADKRSISICPYCAVGCARLMYARGNDITHIEGDPRRPINQGTLWPKSAPTLGWIQNPNRVTKVKYRAAFSDHWEERPLDWAMERIAQLVKRTRDETFVRRLPDGTIVNHTTAMAGLGGATLDNEENYLIKKLRGSGLGKAATHARWDLANADCVVIMGSNMAENYLVAFRFALQAKERNGATIIHVDPRFTRTSAYADIYAPVRGGSDLAFLGGLINYASIAARRL